MKRWKKFQVLLALPVAILGSSKIPWTELTESDWVYSLATRFSVVDGHRVHYPTPTAELVNLLQSRSESAALRHLADARLEMGDRPGAVSCMEKWSEREGAPAWAETARWAYAHKELSAAFKAADKAIPGLPEEQKLKLSVERIQWADLHPEFDPIALREKRVRDFPDDEAALEGWIQKLIQAHRLEEADKALAASKALSGPSRLLIRSGLLEKHQKPLEAWRLLDEAILKPEWLKPRALQESGVRDREFCVQYAKLVDQVQKVLPQEWRKNLEQAFDPGALGRLTAYFQGQQRGNAALDLLRLVERKYEKDIKRSDHLLLSRLYLELDAVPEAFRAQLSAAHLGNPKEQRDDLATLARLALKAGGRPLAVGTYNDESYKWASQTDRTPGFWTGGLAFLLTGLDWKETFARLESESVPHRTFSQARLLVEELARREPEHRELPSLRASLMERHVERGEGREALALLPLASKGDPAVVNEGQRIALLAMRQVEVSLAEERQLMSNRLRFLAKDGSRPLLREAEDSERELFSSARLWGKPGQNGKDHYSEVLEDCLARLENRDPSHRASLDLMLTELDRLPDAEALWMNFADRLENWNLDDELGPRFAEAIKRFQAPGLWDKCARWYARRSRHSELRSLAAEITQRFRASELFRRLDGTQQLQVEIIDPALQGRTRMVLWADWVRLKALERFPHSPMVFKEATQHVLTVSQWNSPGMGASRDLKAVAPDKLMEERRWALLFSESAVREDFFAQHMKARKLESKLLAMEGKERSPVENMLLFEGWARLSQFERAAAFADQLAATYPGSDAIAKRALSLHRSLNALENDHLKAAKAIVERTAPALENPNALWTELGELEEERGNPKSAMELWQNLIAKDPRNPEAVSELATLLWDYNHDAEALSTVETGRKLMKRPRFFAFETGVLRENLKDIDGAVLEYLGALRSERGDTFESDQRALRRLAQLLTRDKVYRVVEKRIRALRPSLPDDEKDLMALMPLGSIEPPVPGLDWTTDDWIDEMDLPNDPAGRRERERKRKEERPGQTGAIAKINAVLEEKTLEMAAKASSQATLDSISVLVGDQFTSRWSQGKQAAFKDLVLERSIDLAVNEEDKIRLEMQRAQTFLNNHQAARAKGVWQNLEGRVAALPPGASKMQAEVSRLKFLESAGSKDMASEGWSSLGKRYDWSLGIQEDHIDYLKRTGQEEKSRALLEDISQRAAVGYREDLLERLTKDSLAGSDFERAKRAVNQLLAEPGLEERKRLAALHLFARLSFKLAKEKHQEWDPFPLVKAEKSKVSQDLQADLFKELACAADREGVHAKGLALWIEALNRRTDLQWLKEACQSARNGGKDQELLAFFEAQHARSPRDVRWAVAVRDIRRFLFLVDGAIEAAKAAVAVRPDREDLWREAVELLIRADRTKEAAGYLEGWNKPRPADEGVARWRSELYARSGDSASALAIEASALDAYKKEAPDQDKNHQERRARAAMRLMEYGLPDKALLLYSKGGDIRAVAGSRLEDEKQTELALMLDQLPGLLSARITEEKFLQAAGRVVRERAKPEQREKLLSWVEKQLLPAQAQSPKMPLLNRLWPLVQSAGMENLLRYSVAQRHVATCPGPWQTQENRLFIEKVSQFILKRHASKDQMEWSAVNLSWLWVEDLSRRDRAQELFAVLEPRWKELFAKTKGSESLDSHSARLTWTGMLDNSKVLETWAREAVSRPEFVKELSGILSSRKLWDRFWTLGARHWNMESLLVMVPKDARLAWFGFWKDRTVKDPVVLAREKRAEEVGTVLGDLVQGASILDSPVLAKLRGPQTVGEVLGKGSQWVWSEFRARKSARGENLDPETQGQGADEGRFPSALWGERPGDAWYVLETLARYRKGDKSASLIPLEAFSKGAETERSLLAIRLARQMGDLPLALELDRERPGAAQDRSRIAQRISLLLAADQKTRALNVWKTYLRKGQSTLTENDFRNLSVLAEELDMPLPLDMLDPSKPVGPAFHAYLVDQRTNLASSFHTSDPAGYRAALAERWRMKETRLSKEQIRLWLKELWAKGSTGLPRRGMARLGGLWPHAGEWLSRLSGPDRLKAIQAIDEVQKPESRLLFELLSDRKDLLSGLLVLRAHLLRNDREQALSVVDTLLREFRPGKASLAFASPLSEGSGDAVSAEEGEGGETPASPSYEPVSSTDVQAETLRAILKPWREARCEALVLPKIKGFLKEAREVGPVSSAAWRLAFDLATAEEVPALHHSLDQAWFRGEVGPGQLGDICEAMAEKKPDEIERWLVRWPRQFDETHTRLRAKILAKAGRRGASAALIFDSRRRNLWPVNDEMKAFDLWRGLGGFASPEAKPPVAWVDALGIWTMKPETLLPALETRLKANRFDVLSARIALKSLAPANEGVLQRVSLALIGEEGLNNTKLFLAVRSARAALGVSHRWARENLGQQGPGGFLRLMTERRLKTQDINGALADFARIYARVEEEGNLQIILGLLAERKAGGLRALRAEFGERKALPGFNTEGGRPAPLQPKDLTWATLAKVLKAEGVK